MHRIQFKLGFILLILAGFILVKPSSAFSQTEIPRHVKNKLKRDAARLSIRMDAGSDDPSMMDIGISVRQSEMIYGILKSIYLSDSPEAKRVNDCRIGVAANIPIERFELVYDKDTDWAASLNDGIFEVESGEVADLIDDYDLVITENYNWDGEHGVIILESPKLYNIAALAQKFLGLPGVHEVNYGDDKKAKDEDIIFSRVEGGWEITFEKQWDQIIKTPKAHTWVFRFMEGDSTVNFIQETGDDLPDWMGCQLITSLGTD